MTKKTTDRLSAIDPLHPLIRKMVRAVQLRDRMIETGLPQYRNSMARLLHVGLLLTDVCGHIRRSAPRIEYDEAAQMRIECDGQPIGTVKRPATMPDCLHPMLEAAIEKHLTGPEVDGDHDAETECAPSDVTGLVEASS
jgi:hypothetical protein